MINSNFSVLPQYFLENAEKCFDEINVSCDASNSVLYEKIRCGLNFDAFQDNVKKFRRKNPNIKMIMCSVLMRQNIADAENQVIFAKKMGFDEIHFGVLGTNSILGNNHDELSHYPNITKLHLEAAMELADKLSIVVKVPKQYIELDTVADSELEKEKKRMREYPFVNEIDINIQGLKQQTLNRKITGAFLQGMKGKGNISCKWPFRNMRIDLAGNIGICCRTAQYMVDNLENVDDIRDIWNGKIYRRIRDQFYKGQYPELCRQCSSKDICRGEEYV